MKLVCLWSVFLLLRRSSPGSIVRKKGSSRHWSLSPMKRKLTDVLAGEKSDILLPAILVDKRSSGKQIALKWVDSRVQLSDELRPDRTLIVGQCFNWRQLALLPGDKTPLFIGVLNGIPLAVTYQNHSSYFMQLSTAGTSTSGSDDKVSIVDNNLRSTLFEYFQLSYSLTTLYDDWSRGCERMATVSRCLQGVRVVKQDPWECLVSFICSSNNNIKRIALMLDRLRFMFGRYLCSVQPAKGEAHNEAIKLETKHSTTSIPDEVIRLLVSFEDQLANRVTPTSPGGVTLPRSVEEVLAHIKSPSQSKRPSVKAAVSNSAGSPLKQERLIDYGASVSAVIESKVMAEEVDEAVSDEDVGDELDPNLTSTVDLEQSSSTIHLFSFPTIESIAAADETALRQLGMGYRAKFIVGTARKIQQLGGAAWLRSLETLGRLDMLAAESRINSDNGSSSRSGGISGCGDSEPRHSSTVRQSVSLEELQLEIESVRNQYNEAISTLAAENVYPGVPGDGNSRLWVQQQLTLLPGVGRKVADCVALFSLNQPAAIPVDTHVWDIAVRNYDPSLANHKSLTPTVYEKVGDIFRDKFGPYAGWAHSVLFASELPEFRALLPESMQQEMKEFARQQILLRAAKKEEVKTTKKAKTAKNSDK